MNKQNNGKTIVFLAMALSQPRCIKRVASLKEYGFNCIVYGYDRGKYDVNSYPSDVTVVNLGQLKDNEYFGKGIKIFKDLLKVRRERRSTNTVFYAFGLFYAFYLRLSGERYIYEISDILYAYPKFKRILGILKTIDKRIIRDSVATVMTSGGFYSFFGLELPKVFVIPNRVSPSLTRLPFKANKETNNKLAFGFVGSLRYQTILDFARVVGESFPHHEFHFWGGLKDGPMKTAVDGLVNQFENVFYHRAFRSPEDLPEVYDSFDITVSCYQVSSLNERLAEPNKLYESMFFNKPIVVSDGIYLSDRVREMDCGYCIDASGKASIKRFVNSLNVEAVRDLSRRISLIDEKLIVSNQNDLNEYIKAFF